MAEAPEVTIESVQKEVVAALEQPAIEEVVAAPEPTEDEDQASGKGWVPEESWVEQGKDAKAWVDAGEFLRRGDLYDKLHKQNRHIRQLQKQLGMLAEQITKTSEVEWDKAYKDLRAQFTSAVKDGEPEQILELQTKLDEMKEIKPVEGGPGDGDTPDPEVARAFNTWQEDNIWYGKDKDKTDYANGIGVTLEKDNPDWTLDEVLEEVSKKVTKLFPARTTKRSAAAVAAPRRAPAKKASAPGIPPASQLPDEVLPVYQMLVGSGEMSHEDYMKDYMAGDGPLKEV